MSVCISMSIWEHAKVKTFIFPQLADSVTRINLQDLQSKTSAYFCQYLYLPVKLFQYITTIWLLIVLSKVLN